MPPFDVDINIQFVSVSATLGQCDDKLDLTRTYLSGSSKTPCETMEYMYAGNLLNLL